MNKKNIALQVLVFVFLCIVSFAEEKQKPNVVFIFVDDLYDWIGVMGGHTQTKTPNLDALAKQGVLFTNAHCNAPQCGPSRTSLLHGLYPKSTGKYFNSPKRMPFYGDQPTQGITSPNAPKNPFVFHKHFKEHGYRVVCGGKVAHGNSRDIIKMRAIATEAFELVKKFNGSHSGEHGDGISRSEFNPVMFGKKLTNAFREIKSFWVWINLHPR